ncbi:MULTISPECIES: LytTR family DNA-binding domain-containing protein [unclassified Myroides]|uniref:LytR/AlgR family response regulator transcription factor n=1 Tax=unclassified Myroides TaxID=2642485 RepID=UPI0015F845D3|nr:MULTISPECIES: LytTR family DNA-binding domain-containing protein [unclassified Myroides]MBB1150764.1 response regulator transcription factor [Myroides sp. NP-2]MDM1407596.1 response regulator transcription factor [Myroides sp. DF42-4-2]
MKVLIVEDEERNANRLTRLLHQIEPDMEIQAVVESVQSCVRWLQTHASPDLIFMDIRLEDGLCFEIFEQIHITIPVIFTTSYDEYALKAFKVNSIDYIMKPVQEEDLQQALTKFKGLTTTIGLTDSIQNILGSLNKKEIVYRSRFLIPYKDGFRTVKVEEIDYLYSELKITHLVLKDKSEMILSQTMEEVEEELNPASFFRANRQHILEIDSIHNIQNYYNGKLKVTLIRDPQREIIISRDKAPLFKNWLNS